jgi:3-hydroxyacyl-CoA dehydrogenase/3a,7a,12a-trihydroxy-5b-cholest-24-enoyl-CoA hydratase
MGKELRFDGKVAVVTGAGNGLGRAHALLLGSRGAKVVVNDLGGSHTGQGKSSAAADKVVAEIKAMGGEAVANYDSVEDGDKIVKTAIDAFGRIDILVNNAGILRDVSFAKMTQDDWDLVYRVHVLGAFRCTQAAWAYMRDQKYGRIIMTASAAGIYGNFGQANYAMAKLGLVGFAQTLAIEGRKNNVLCNVIAPIAGSRMTETVLPPELVAALSPEYVSPLVAKLCHESSDETGGLFEVGGGFYAKLRWERAAGKMYRLGRPVSIEDLEQAWGTITSFENATHPAHIAASIEPIIKNVEAGRSKGGNQYIDVDSALGYQFPDHRSSYDERDLALYALGVGAASDPTDDHDLQLVYELHGSGMKALPTYGVIPAINAILTLAKEGKQAPGLTYGLDRVLHGEQYLEVLRPLPSKAKLTHKARIKDIFDKGKGAVVITAVDSYDDAGELLVRNEVSTFVRGVGGWGGDRGPSAEINVPPTRPADQRVEERIHENQALLYRLSGDWNPLHADPGFAKAFGFDKPILHGLCTFGYASRHVLRHFAKDGDPRYFKSIKVRFADSVFPGETLVTEMWRESDTRIIFRCSVKEREKVVISNAAIELYAEIPKAAAKVSSTAKPAGSAPAAMPISADIFGGIAAYIAKNSDAVGKVKTVYCFKLKGPDSSWTLDLKNGSGSVSAGEVGTADCTLEISDADFMDMCTGKADAMKLFTTGKLKITGNIMASQKLEFLKQIDPSDVIAAMQKRTGGGAATAAPASSAPAAMPISADIFGGIAAYIGKNSDAVGKVKTVYCFKLKGPDSSWTLDLKNGSGSVSAGEVGTADCTLEINDADFMDMCTGKADAMKLFTTGKLKITGNIMASQKLEFLKKIDPSDVIAAMKKRTGSGAAASSSPASSAPAAKEGAKEGRASTVFAALSKRLATDAGIAAAVRAVIEVRVTDPASIFTVDLAGAGQVVSGAAAKPDLVLTIADADLLQLASGASSVQSLYQHGKLRVDGQARLAHHLGFFAKLI